MVLPWDFIDSPQCTWLCLEMVKCKVRTFWEMHKIWKNLPHDFDKSADLLSKRQNLEEDFFQIMSASQKVQTLYNDYNVVEFLSSFFILLKSLKKSFSRKQLG